MTTGSLPFLLTNVGYFNSQDFTGQAQVWVDPQSEPASANYQSDLNHPSPIWALVLDRSNPTGPAVFEGFLPSNTEVPAKLAAAMSPSNILVFIADSKMPNVPQGDLFKLLAANGGGAQLIRMEEMSTYISCGQIGTYCYTLVSIPGSNTVGFEALDDSVQFVMSLVPSPSGYTPVLIG